MAAVQQTRSLADLFKVLQDSAVLESAREYARVTSASVFQDKSTRDSQGKRTDIDRDYQSFGSLLVNNLTAKTAEMLFPTDSPFFKIDISKSVRDMLNNSNQYAQFKDKNWAMLENEASSMVFMNDGYAEICRALQLCIVTGNALLYRDKVNNSFRTYDLNDYAVYRNDNGIIQTIIIREKVARRLLSKEVLARINQTQTVDDKDYTSVDLYTRLELNASPKENDRSSDTEDTVTPLGYIVTQEIANVKLAEEAYYPMDMCPYMVLAWKLCTGEHYGRGHVEDYIADLARYSEISFSSFLYTAEALKFVNIIPTAAINQQDMIDADCGDYVVSNGTGADGYTLEGGTYNKMVAAREELQFIEMRLARGFMYTSAQRDAERVTAEEVRAVIREAQSMLQQGYTTLSVSLQKRLASVLLSEIDEDVSFLLQAEVISLDITVGLSSLSRSALVTKLQYAANAISMVCPVLAQTSARFNIDKVVEAIFDGFGINIEDYVYSEEELNAKIEQQQSEMQQNAANMQVSADINSNQLGLTK